MRMDGDEEVEMSCLTVSTDRHGDKIRYYP